MIPTGEKKGIQESPKVRNFFFRNILEGKKCSRMIQEKKEARRRLEKPEKSRKVGKKLQQPKKNVLAIGKKIYEYEKVPVLHKREK